ncbi:MAG TPA: hypothetical protein VFR06_07185 [Gallionellaceae bacterium]|nr:hypothetical protein [Gallionellaceae bacterium]
MSESTNSNTTSIPEINDGLTPEERDGLHQLLQGKLNELAQLEQDKQLAQASPLVRARLQLDIAEALNALERKPEAWTLARDSFNIALQQAAWQDAVEACDVLFQTEQEDSIAALCMGIWLSITFPVDPELTLTMLIHFVDSSPGNSDATALAAITGRYVVDLRAGDEQHESQSFLADNLISMVAKRHSNVKDQEAMDKWLTRLELRKPEVFLPRFAEAINTLVGDKWWFDRDELRSQLPDY